MYKEWHSITKWDSVNKWHNITKWHSITKWHNITKSAYTALIILLEVAVFFHNFSLSLFAPIFIYIFLSYICTVV